MADGIIQYIKLALDKASAKKLQQDAADQSKQVGNAMTGAMQTATAAASGNGSSWASKFMEKASDRIAQLAPKLRMQLERVLVPERGAVPTIPDAVLMSGMERARARKTFKGSNNDFADYVASENKNRQAKVEQQRLELERLATAAQLAGTKLTWLGKVSQAMGNNVAATSPKIQAMTKQLAGWGMTQNQINKVMPAWSKNYNAFSSSVASVAKSFGLVFSVSRALAFLKDTVKVAGESEVAWAQLSTTISDYGGKLSELMPKIQPLFDAQAKLGVSYTSSAKNLARLVQITGDLNGSMRALPVVQDMAASGFMSLEQASKQVGRAMLGDIGSISRYGIFLNKNKDVLDQLGKRFGGEQAMRAKTLTGQLERMAIAWYETKVAMGQALAAGANTNGFFDRIIGWLKDMKYWVLQNQVAIKVLGQTILAVFTGIGVVIFGLVNGFTQIFNAATTVGVAITTIFKNLPRMVFVAFTEMDLIVTKTMRSILSHIDQAFGSNLASTLDKSVLELTRRSLSLNKKIGKSFGESGAVISEIWKGGEEEPRAADARGQPGLHIRAREHATRRKSISDVRANVLSSDLGLRERGLKRLEEIEADINSRMEEEKDNELELIELGKERAQTIKIREDLEKKLNTAQKEEAAYNRRISKLSAIAREEDDAQAMKAVKLLQIEHDKLIAKRKKLSVGSEEWLKVEDHIKDVEDGINGHMEKQDKLFDDRVKRLAAMIDLDVNRADAAGQVTQMMDEQNKEFDKQNDILNSTVKGSKEYNAALDAQVKAKQKLVALETALRAEIDLPDSRIDQLETELKIGEKRVAAEKALEQLRKLLNIKAAEGKTDQIRSTARRQAGRITSILEGDDKVDINVINKEINAARELMKHTSSRVQAAKELEKVQEHIATLMDKGNLTEAERLQLQKQQLQVTRLLHDAAEPTLNLWEELQYIMENDLPNMAEHVATAMSDVFETAFTYIIRDSRNLSHALNSIPKGFAKAMLHEIAEMAKGKAKENLAWALEETAKGIGMAATGNFAGASAAFASAGQHVAAATAWGLLGGVAGATGISASQAYSNATDFASGDRGSTADKAGAHGPDIYLQISGVDPKNPRHQQLIGDANREYQERYGGRIILVPGSAP